MIQEVSELKTFLWIFWGKKYWHVFILIIEKWHDMTVNAITESFCYNILNATLFHPFKYLVDNNLNANITDSDLLVWNAKNNIEDKVSRNRVGFCVQRRYSRLMTMDNEFYIKFLVSLLKAS